MSVETNYLSSYFSTLLYLKLSKIVIYTTNVYPSSWVLKYVLFTSFITKHFYPTKWPNDIHKTNS